MIPVQTEFAAKEAGGGDPQREELGLEQFLLAKPRVPGVERMPRPLMLASSSTSFCRQKAPLCDPTPLDA